MAEESGFFTGVAGDRKYTARFMNEKLHEAMQRADGILAHSDDAFEVISDGSLTITMGKGVAMKGGVYYRNTSPLSLTLDEPTLGKKRYDRVAIRIDRYRRTMVATVLKGREAAAPAAPLYLSDDDIEVEKIFIDHSAGPIVLTLTDERQMRPVFITNNDSIDALIEGQVYGRIIKAKADALNAGQNGISFVKFIHIENHSLETGTINCALRLESDVVLAGYDKNNHLAYSNDHGITLKNIDQITLSTGIRSLAYTGSAYLAGTDGKIFRAPSYFLNPWTEVWDSEYEEFIETFCILSTSNIIATGSSRDKIIGSTDGGLTWSYIGTCSNEGLKVLEGVGGTVVLAGSFASGKMFRSTDSGVTWAEVKSTGIEEYPYTFIKHLGNGIVLAGLEHNAKLFRSTDYGLTWDDGREIDGQIDYSAIFVDGTTIYMGCRRKIYVSTDLGASWIKKWEIPEDDWIKFIYINNDGILVVITTGSNVSWGYTFEA